MSDKDYALKVLSDIAGKPQEAGLRVLADAVAKKLGKSKERTGFYKDMCKKYENQVDWYARRLHDVVFGGKNAEDVYARIPPWKE